MEKIFGNGFSGNGKNAGKCAGTTDFSAKPERASELPVALTIAGSDSGGGAGAQADLLTFAALGVFGTTALAALTAQNPSDVSDVFTVPAAFVREQAEQVARFFRVRAAKTGMLTNAEIIGATADFFEAHREILLVVDPVMIATSGAKLIAEHAVETLRERLLPLATLVTPNLDEAEVFLGEKIGWRENPRVELEEICATAMRLAETLGVPALLKGGHGVGDEIFDVLAFPRRADAKNFVFRQPRIEKINTHGSGCTLSAAIAAELARATAEFSERAHQKLAGTPDATNAPDAAHAAESTETHAAAGKISTEIPAEIPAEILAESVGRAEKFIRTAMVSPIRVGGENFIAHLRKISVPAA